MAQRTILLYDRFGIDWWTGEGITAKWFQKELNDAKEDPDCDSILVAINSPGGNINEGIAIYNEIIRNNQNAQNPPIDTRNDGVAYSMGAIVLMAGRNVAAHQNTTTLLHNCLGGAYGNVRDLKNTINMMEAVDNGIVASVAAKMGKTEDEVKNEIFNYDDHTYSAKEALELKIIDEIIPDRTEAGDMLEGKSYKEVMAYFRAEPSAERKSILQAMRKGIQGHQPPTQNSQPSKTEDPMKIKNSFTALLSLFGLSAVENTEHTEHQPTDAQLKALNEKLEKAATDASDLEAANTRIAELEGENKTLTAENVRLGQAAPPPANPGDDTITDEGKSESFISESDQELKNLRSAEAYPPTSN